MVQPVETVCQMCPNRPLIRNGSLTSQTDFEVKALYAMASKFPYTAYLTKRTGASFIQDELR